MSDSSAPKRSTLRLGHSLISFFVVIVLFAFLPSLLSTKWGGYCLQQLIRASTSLEIHWEECSISWFTDSQLKGISIIDHHSHVKAFIDKIDSTWNARSLFSSIRSIGTTSIQGAYVEFFIPSTQTDQWLYPLIPHSLSASHKTRIPFDGMLYIEQSTLICKVTETQQIALKDLSLSLFVPAQKGTINCGLSAIACDGQEKGTITLLAEYRPQQPRKLLQRHADTVLALAENRLHFDIQMDHFPSILFDAFRGIRHVERSHFTAQALGPFFDCRIKTEAQTPHPSLSILWKSPLLTGRGHLALNTTEMTFSTPEPILWTPSPLLFEHVLPSLSQTWKLNEPPLMRFSIPHLSIQPQNEKVLFNGSVLADIEPISLQIHPHIDSANSLAPLNVSLSPCSTRITLTPKELQWNLQMGLEWNQKASQFSCSGEYALGKERIEWSSFRQIQLSCEAVPTLLLDQWIQRDNWFQPLFGDVIALHLSMHPSIETTQQDPQQRLRILCLSPTLQCDPIEISLGTSFKLLHPVHLKMQNVPLPFSSEGKPLEVSWDSFTASSQQPFEAHFTLPIGMIELSLSRCALPRFSLSSLQLIGELYFSPHPHQEQAPPYTPHTLLSTPVVAHFHLDGTDQRADLQLTSLYPPQREAYPSWKGSLSIEKWLEGGKWSPQHLRWHLEASSPALELAQFQTLFPFSIDVPLLFGKSLACALSTTYDPSHDACCLAELFVHGEGFEGHLNGKWRNAEELDLTAGTLMWKIGPQRFSTLHHFWPFLKEWTLYEDSTWLFSLKNGHFPLSLERLKKAESPFVFHLTSSPFTLVHFPSQSHLNCHAEGVINEKMRYQLHAFFPTSLEEVESSCKVEGSFRDLFVSQEPNRANTSLSCQVIGIAVPSALLMLPFYATPELYTLSTHLLGKQCSFKASLKTQSDTQHMQLHLQSLSGIKCHFDATAEAKRVRFNHPCRLILPLNLFSIPLTLPLFHDQQNPMMRSLVQIGTLLEEKKGALSWTLYPENSFLQLPYRSWDDIQLDQLILEIGKITLKAPKKRSMFFNILPKELYAKTVPFSICSTPLFFSLYHGTLQLKRVDALVANRYPIALWGRIKFPTNNVKATLAVSATALRQGYGLGDIPPGYFLLLPMSGSLNNIALHKTKALTRLTALSLHSDGGIPGAFLGSFAHWLGGQFDPKQVPPPSSPIPWATRESELQSQEGGCETAKENSQKSLSGLLLAPLKAVHRGIQNSVRKGADLFFHLLR